MIGRSLGHQRAMFAVEGERRSLHHVRVLPDAGIPGVHRERRGTMYRHRAAGNVDRIGGGEQSPVRLGLQVGIGALDVALSRGVAIDPPDANRLGSGGHACIGHPRGTTQKQQLVRRGVGGALRPRFSGSVHVSEVALLRD